MSEKNTEDETPKREKKRKRSDTASAPMKIAKAEPEPVIVEDQHIDDYRPNAEKSEIPSHLRLENNGLSESTIQALLSRNVKSLFPIQAASIGPIMQGKDLLGRARTGTGKTLAFSLPMIEVLKKIKQQDQSSFNARNRAPKVLIMAPTRELALQVHKEFDGVSSGSLVSTCIYGGVPYDSQCQAFRNGVDVAIGTPGRLIDHIERGNMRLNDLRFICMDEADQMLDIGFAQDMERILELVKTQKQEGGAPDHQTLLFSATMPDWIKEAVRKYMKPDKITLDLIGTDKQKTSATVKHCCLTSRWQNRAAVLGDIVAVYGRGNAGRTIIFVETKGECNELVMNEKLVAMGAQCLHGDIAQNQRETTMAGFRKGLFSCLITTNVCARGVDIPEVDLVINCEPPKDVESYIHRSGRTGRAGRSGTCVTFYKSTQENLIQNITRRAGVEFTYIGAPQAKDVVAARAFETLEIMKDGLDEQVLEYFGDAAKELLNYYNNDGIKALSGALAMICQVTKPLPSRSLLTANEGFVSVMFQVDKPIRHVGYVKSMLQRNHPGVGYDATPIWRMTIDSMGVIADISEDKVQIDNGQISLGGIPWNNDNGVVACIPTELPELQERPDMVRDNFRGGSRGGRGNYGNSRGNYGNSRGGYGNSRGGYGNSRGASRGRGRY